MEDGRKMKSQMNTVTECSELLCRKSFLVTFIPSSPNHVSCMSIHVYLWVRKFLKNGNCLSRGRS